MKELKIFGLRFIGTFPSVRLLVGNISAYGALPGARFTILSRMGSIYCFHVGSRKGKKGPRVSCWSLKLAGEPIYTGPNSLVRNIWGESSSLLMRRIVPAIEKGQKVVFFSEDGRNCQFWTFEEEIPKCPS